MWHVENRTKVTNHLSQQAVRLTGLKYYKIT